MFAPLISVIFANQLCQGILKGFEELGFKTESQPLSHFYESYGLEADEEDEDDEDDDVDEDDESGSGSDEDMSDAH